MGTTIRTAHPSDLPYLYEICLKTGADGKDATALFPDPWLIGQYYAAPYLVHDPSLCFVAEANAVPRGYVIATDDTLRFNAWLNEFWLPPLRVRYPESLREAGSLSNNALGVVAQLHAPRPMKGASATAYLARYPAHLHIDLLPELQGQGCGRNLLERLFFALRSRRVEGIHLGVSTTNPGAIAFYRKCGFTVLETESWGLVMGKTLE